MTAEYTFMYPLTQTQTITNDEATASSSNLNVAASFADKLKGIQNLELQVAIYAEPLISITDLGKIELTEAIAEVLYELPENEVLPTFLSTTRRENYVIITAKNETSRDWLLKIVPSLRVWNNASIKCIPAKDLPKHHKGLLWLPGSLKPTNEIIMKRLARHNAHLRTNEWKIFSRHEEEHGIRLLVGVIETDMRPLEECENRPQWSTTRAQFTPIQQVAERAKLKKPGSQKPAARNINQNKADNKPMPMSSSEITAAAEPEIVIELADKEEPVQPQRDELPHEGEALLAETPSATMKPSQSSTAALDYDPFTPNKKLLRSPQEREEPNAKKVKGSLMPPKKPTRITGYFEKKLKSRENQ